MKIGQEFYKVIHFSKYTKVETITVIDMVEATKQHYESFYYIHNDHAFWSPGITNEAKFFTEDYSPTLEGAKALAKREIEYDIARLKKEMEGHQKQLIQVDKINKNNKEIK